MRALLRKSAIAFGFTAAWLVQAVFAQSGNNSLLIDVPSPEAPIQSPAEEPGTAIAPKPEFVAKPPARVKDVKPVAAAKAVFAAPAPVTSVVPLAIDGRGPDESALRYYASLQQTQRVETEMKRLKRLYPNWQPPENIYNTPSAGGVDEQPFWDLYAVGNLRQLREDIKKRTEKEPGWQPSADLMDKVRRKEMRTSISSLWKAGKWKDIVAFIKDNTDSVADDTDVDILWTVAEAYAKTKQTEAALKTYKSIMKSNRDPGQRLATVQKSMSVLRMSDVEELISMSHAGSNERNELDPIALDITRGRISAFLHDERVEEIPETELKAFEEFARKDNDPNQPGLMAWYYYKIKTFSQALEWFKFAISKGGDSMIAHGLAHSLRELGMYRETEEVSYVWREPLVNNAILFIDILERDLTKEIPPYIEPERLLRYAQVTMDSAAGEGAQGLAWYAYNSCQFNVALEWFERSMAWLPKEATAYGYALTLQRLKKSKEFWDVLNRYDGLFPKVIDIIYPDDLYHPPTPCDLVDGKGQVRARQQVQPNYTVPAPYLQGQPYAAAPVSSGYGAAPAPAYGGSPQPLAQTMPQPAYSQATPGYPAQPSYPAAPFAQPQAGYYQDPDKVYRREPKIDRKNFPIPVNPQNPLRYYPTGRFMGPQAPVASSLMATPAQMMSEAAMRMRQLVARRVPDVGPMPYERWGYALLPAYNGLTTATGPHSADKAPMGTLWTTLQAKDAQSTRGGAFDPLRQDLAALIARMKSIPPVPPPGASITGPWSSPKPYKSREQLEAEGLLAPQNVSAGPADANQPSLTPSPSSVSSNAARVAPVAAASPLPPEATNPAMSRQIEEQSRSEQPAGRVESRSKDALGRQAENAYNRKQFEETLAALDRRQQTLPETVDLRLIRAWSLLNLNRVEEARRVFGTLKSSRQGQAGAHDARNMRTR